MNESNAEFGSRNAELAWPIRLAPSECDRNLPHSEFRIPNSP
jgi:hypothetical protein